MGSNYSGGYGTPDGLGGYSKYKFSLECLSSDRGKGGGLWAGRRERGRAFLKRNLWALHIVLLQEMLVKSSSAGVLLA